MPNRSFDRQEIEPIRREYQRLAAHYDARWSFYIDATTEATLERLTLKPGAKILDIGCGTGALLSALSQTSVELELTGVDLSPEMLEIARARLSPAIEIKEGLAEHLPFADTTFDMVVSTSVFHFIRRPSDALSEMKRVLKPGGWAVITDWCDDYLSCRVCNLFLRRFNRAHFHTYRKTECEQLMIAAGFEDVHAEMYKINWLWGLMTAKGKAPGHAA